MSTQTCIESKCILTIFLFLLPKPGNSSPTGINPLLCWGIPPLDVPRPVLVVRALSHCEGATEICAEREWDPAGVVSRAAWISMVNVDGFVANQLTAHESFCNELPRVTVCVGEPAEKEARLRASHQCE